MKGGSKFVRLSLIAGTFLFGSQAYAGLEFTEPEVLSSEGVITGDGLAFKTKLVRMGNGLLVTVYGDKNGPDVYDVKGNEVRPARDIYVRTCMPSDANNQCELQSSWSEAVNISNTAQLSSIATKWQDTDENGVMDDAPVAFYGDSEKPNIFNAGSFAVVTWIDKYCPGGEQKMIAYNERDGLTVPFSCVYESHINFKDAEPAWTTTQITDASRDAKQDVNKGLSVGTPATGKWLITWQEDPHGLQLGSGDGPGDGASGANVTHGTDIWYTYTEDLMNAPFNAPVRMTNNMTGLSEGGNTSPVYDNAGTLVTSLEHGTTGASRANSAMVPGTTPIALVTYEETKGADRLDSGKFVRYHSFPFNTPDTNAAGAIISDPNENARRVRFVTQAKPGANGMMMGIFWRQGYPVEGGPGDIMLRLGFINAEDPNSTGFRFQDMVPTVDPNAEAIDYAAATLINNAPAYNLSSNTIPWTPIGGAEEAPTNTFADATDLNPYEDARAHRAVIRGDDFHIGYSYAKDWAVASFTDMDNYNFWVRTYNSADDTWTDAKNISNITDKGFHVKEPRLVGMPGNGPGCADGVRETASNPDDCQDKKAILAGWGIETNVYSHVGGSEEGDIYYTRSKDGGATYLEASVVPGIGTSNRFESQLRSSPSGNIIFSVWNETNNDVGGSYSMLSVSTSESEAVTPDDGGDTDDTDDTTTSGGGGGCSYNPNQKGMDIMFLIMASLGFLYFLRRKVAAK